MFSLIFTYKFRLAAVRSVEDDLRQVVYSNKFTSAITFDTLFERSTIHILHFSFFYLFLSFFFEKPIILSPVDYLVLSSGRRSSPGVTSSVEPSVDASEISRRTMLRYLPPLNPQNQPPTNTFLPMKAVRS